MHQYIYMYRIWFIHGYWKQTSAMPPKVQTPAHRPCKARRSPDRRGEFGDSGWMCLNIALNGMNTEQQCDNVNVGVNLMLTSVFLCVLGGIRMLPCMFLSITLCLFAFELTPFLNSMIGVDGLEVVDMCWAAVRMYSGYSWRFLETSQCDVTMILLFTESTSSHTRAIVPCQDFGWSSVGAFESWTPFQQVAVQNQRPFPGLS